MGALVNRAYLQASPVNLATDLARYGSAAEWRGVYYRGEKIGFTVSQTTRTADGFELQEDGRLQMSLLGADDGGDDPDHGARRSRRSPCARSSSRSIPGTGAGRGARARSIAGAAADVPPHAHDRPRAARGPKSASWPTCRCCR